MKHFASAARAGTILLGLLPVTALGQLVPKLVDVESSSSVSRFSIHRNGALLAGGEFNGGLTYEGFMPIPAEGSGTRLLWYPGKAAFRAGRVNGTQWDDANVGLYSVALGENVRALGDNAFAMGHTCVAANTGTVAMGQYCTAVGANSVALGYYAETRTMGGSPRQGTFVFADRSVTDDGSSTTYEGFNVDVNHAAAWRVTGGFRVVTGGAGSANGYIPNRGVSILPATNTSSITTNWGQTAALIATSSGAYLSDGGTWTNASDVNKKRLFEAVSGEDVLARLRPLRIQRWGYKNEPAGVRHLGPMAQDFRRAFGLGADSISIGTVDADGVALAGVQALDARTLKQADELAALKAENQALKARLDALDRQASTHAAGLPLWSALLLAAGIGAAALLLRRRRPAAGTPA